MATTDTLYIDGVDVQTYADIADFSGVLQDAPARGDLIEMDFQPGAVWEAGTGGAVYSFDLSLIMQSDDEDAAIVQLQALQAMVGTQVTLWRVAAGISSTCEAVVTSAIAVEWNLDARNLIGAVMVFQNLSGGWAPGYGS